ncbi:MAG: sigma-70 family RNA polymerase sigma factor [Saprospiraceae bacterium]|nr:sigma-70 family RNA polymerase sigma factor [Saprospiraceae bacterium]
MLKDSDEYLLDRIRAGDKKAFQVLVERYQNVSYTLACSIVKDEQRAEDVLQDAFVKVFKHLKSFREGAKFSTWLYRIVVNAAYTAIEKEQRHSSRRAENPKELIVIDEEKIFSKLQQHERKKHIQAVFMQMKAEEALLLRLYYLAELSVKEIQKTTGFSASKIKVGLHRARKNMLTHLRRQMGDESKHLI